MSQVSASEPTAVIPDLRDKVVLITGASTGIGAAAARAFGRNGAKVAINDRQSQAEAEQGGFQSGIDGLSSWLMRIIKEVGHGAALQAVRERRAR
jgi:NAD(P)-dependent dehydrogenase (short-subunit alcohol dehydrogenase family)